MVDQPFAAHGVTSGNCSERSCLEFIGRGGKSIESCLQKPQREFFIFT